VLYVGVTGFLMSRVLQHKTGESGFTSRYHVNRLVYYEVFKYVNRAIARETEIKKWRRERKVALIERHESRVGGSSGWLGPACASGNSRFLLVAARRVGMTRW
jgi:predicted GIY-YIG superfamily endonuclease